MKIYKVLLILFILMVPLRPAVAQDTSGYPIEDFLGCTIFNEVEVSPDGRHVAMITATDDFAKDCTDVAIWRIDLDEAGRKTGMLRLSRAEGNYNGMRWSPEGCYLAFLSTRKPAETPQLFVLDMAGGEPILLTDPEKFKEGIAAYDWLPDGNGLVFAAPELPDKEKEKARKEYYGDALRFASQTPRTTFWRLAIADFSEKKAQILSTVDQRVEELCLSPDGMRIAYLSGPPAKPAVFYDSYAQREVFLLRAGGDAPPLQLTHNFVEEKKLQWARDGSALYANGIGKLDAKRSVWTNGRLYRIDLDNGCLDNLVPGFVGDLSPINGLAPYTQLPDGSLIVIANVSTRINAYAVDPIRHRVKPLTDYRGEVMNLSASQDGELIAFALVTNKSFPELYLATSVEKLSKARRINDFNAKLTKMPMPDVETIHWENGEDDTIEGVLYWPPGHRGEKNLPLVVDIHGGPVLAKSEAITFNNNMTFAFYPALLASRGYLVLEPNYRGSTGRGDDFQHAIEGYGISRPATDIMRGVDYVQTQGWADPDLMGVMGYSYGGQLTNCLITRTDRFLAACSGSGVWNETSCFIAYFGFIFSDFLFMGNAPWENFRNYWEESAISRAGNIRTPTLVTHGGADRNVPTSQGYEFYRALVRLDVPTELLVFPGEEHGFQKPSHKLTKVKAQIAWLDHYILGKPLPKF
ncbi:S9 family peptidase [Candidatus Latescibacterota bacterium]